MSNKKKLNTEIRQRHEMEMEIKANPDICFCEEPEYDINNPIDETGMVYYSIYDFNKENPISLPIFKCNKCNKKYVMFIAEA